MIFKTGHPFDTGRHDSFRRLLKIQPNKPTLKMTKRLLSALFGGTLFAIITSIAYWLIFKGMPLEGLFSGVILLTTCGIFTGGDSWNHVPEGVWIPI